MGVFSGRSITFKGMDRNVVPDIPEPCGICGTNPAVFEFHHRSESSRASGKTGHCCTSCAFTMLLGLAKEEIDWLALATT